MMTFSTKTFALALRNARRTHDIRIGARTAATPWELKPDTGYAYGKDGKTFTYKMGTNNAGTAAEGRQEGAERHAVLHRP